MSSDPTGWISHPVPAGNDGMHARALANALSVATQRPEFKTVLEVKWPAPNAELRGARQQGSPPVRRMIGLCAARAGCLLLRVPLNDLLGGAAGTQRPLRWWRVKPMQRGSAGALAVELKRW